eukprot:jgi/Undpi1/4119/HiC_scaffold_16.g07486.m1
MKGRRLPCRPDQDVFAFGHVIWLAASKPELKTPNMFLSPEEMTLRNVTKPCFRAALLNPENVCDELYHMRHEVMSIVNRALSLDPTERQTMRELTASIISLSEPATREGMGTVRRLPPGLFIADGVECVPRAPGGGGGVCGDDVGAASKDLLATPVDTRAEAASKGAPSARRLPPGLPGQAPVVARATEEATPRVTPVEDEPAASGSVTPPLKFPGHAPALHVDGLSQPMPATLYTAPQEKHDGDGSGICGNDRGSGSGCYGGGGGYAPTPTTAGGEIQECDLSLVASSGEGGSGGYVAKAATPPPQRHWEREGSEGGDGPGGVGGGEARGEVGWGGAGEREMSPIPRPQNEGGWGRGDGRGKDGGKGEGNGGGVAGEGWGEAAGGETASTPRPVRDGGRGGGEEGGGGGEGGEVGGEGWGGGGGGQASPRPRDAKEVGWGDGEEGGGGGGWNGKGESGWQGKKGASESPRHASAAVSAPAAPNRHHQQQHHHYQNRHRHQSHLVNEKAARVQGYVATRTAISRQNRRPPSSGGGESSGVSHHNNQAAPQETGTFRRPLRRGGPARTLAATRGQSRLVAGGGSGGGDYFCMGGGGGAGGGGSGWGGDGGFRPAPPSDNRQAWCTKNVYCAPVAPSQWPVAVLGSVEYRSTSVGAAGYYRRQAGCGGQAWYGGYPGYAWHSGGGVVWWISHRRKLEKMDGVSRGAGGGDAEGRSVKTDRSESS